jgi:hypothetical protein
MGHRLKHPRATEGAESSDHTGIGATSIMRQSHHYWSYNKDAS